MQTNDHCTHARRRQVAPRRRVDERGARDSCRLPTRPPGDADCMHRLRFSRLKRPVHPAGGGHRAHGQMSCLVRSPVAVVVLELTTTSARRIEGRNQVVEYTIDRLIRSSKLIDIAFIDSSDRSITVEADERKYQHRPLIDQ